MKSLLIRLFIQFAYVNTVMLAGIQVYYLLPKILNALIVFLAIPILLIFVFKYIGQFMIQALKTELDKDTLLIPLGISAATLWLALLASLFDFTGAGYLQLIKKQVIENIPVKEAHNYSNAGYISFADGHAAFNYYGEIHHISTQKSGDDYYQIHNAYYTYPVVSATWTPEQPVHIWLCESTSTSFTEHPKLPNLNISVIQGTPVHDPYYLNYYSQAIKNAAIKHGVKTHNNALLMLYNEFSYKNLIKIWRIRFIIFMCVVNLLWAGIPGLLMIKKFWTAF